MIMEREIMVQKHHRYEMSILMGTQTSPHIFSAKVFLYRNITNENEIVISWYLGKLTHEIVNDEQGIFFGRPWESSKNCIQF